MSDSEGSPALDAYIRRQRRRRLAGILLVVLLAALPIALLMSGRAYEIEVIPPKASAAASISRAEGRLLVFGATVMLFSSKGTVRSKQGDSYPERSTSTGTAIVSGSG